MKTVLILLLLTGSAAAHDSWENKYKDFAGITCCGPNDCHVVSKLTHEITGGFRVDGKVQIGTSYDITIHETIPYAQATPSEDEDYHICGAIYGGGRTVLIQRRCFFAPQRSY